MWGGEASSGAGNWWEERGELWYSERSAHFQRKEKGANQLAGHIDAKLAGHMEMLPDSG